MFFFLLTALPIAFVVLDMTGVFNTQTSTQILLLAVANVVFGLRAYVEGPLIIKLEDFWSLKFRNSLAELEEKFEEFKEDLNGKFEEKFEEFKEDLDGKFEEFKDDLDGKFEEFKEDLEISYP